jgi:biopolymer transport protein TolR
MARKKKRIDGDLAKANLTPMIDVTFQLIIFFLLVNNIVSEESVSMLVPKLFDPKVKELGDVKRLVVSIIPPEDPPTRKTAADALLVNGEPLKVKLGFREYDISNLDDLIAELKESKERDENIQVLLRADAATYYDRVQPVLAAITTAGIKTVNLVAFLPDEGPDNLPFR